MDDTITILHTVDDPTFGDGGKLVERLRVTFKVGTQGPFVLLFDRASFSGVSARAAIETFARELRALQQ